MNAPEAINPHILVWAREAAGLSLEEAAARLGLRTSERSTAAEKLRAFESGERAPSPSQIAKAASVYRRPLITFYLAEPPRQADRVKDFRTTGGNLSSQAEGLLDSLLRDLRARQQLLRAMLEDEEEAVALPFVANSDMKQGAMRTAHEIREALGVSVDEQRTAKGTAGLFKLLRSAAEQIGIFVLLLGDIGSHHSDIGEHVFRGIALVDDVVPFVIINDNDARPARSFTLMHELAHVWIGASGVSGPLETMSVGAVERFCNDVAGEFLLPVDALRQEDVTDDSDFLTILEETARIASAWNVSQALVTYRLARDNRISGQMASRLFDHFGSRWREQKQRTKETGDSTGPSYYVVRRHRLGAALLTAVQRGLEGEFVTHTTAGKILGVAPYNVSALLRPPPPRRPRAA